MTMMRVGRLPQIQSDKIDWLVWGVIAAWVLSMIALPILRWGAGDAALPAGIVATVVIQAVAAFAALYRHWGLLGALRALLLVGFITWIAEFVGSRTGFPFGYYHYTEFLQPQLAGVPLFVPFAWFMMLPSAWAVAQVVVGMQCRWAFAAVSAIALTAWDLFLDPQKVAWGLWVWTETAGGAVYSGGYFGIPWVNFLGWLLIASIVTFIVRPRDLPLRPLLVIYAITWVFQAIGQLMFWGLPGPGIVGFLGMGAVMLLVWARRRSWQ